MTRSARLGVAALAAALAASLSPAAGAATFQRGVMLGDTGSTGADVAAWFANAQAAGTTFVRLNVKWSEVAPGGDTRPAGFNAADPLAPDYRWSALDEQLENVADHGIEPLLTIFSAPAWAEGQGRPSGAAAGSWQPDPAALAEFAAAAAQRYSGSTPDPLRPGRVLPRVRDWQIWNEPNLSVYLAPQWAGHTAVAPGLFARMLRAAYPAIKAVHADNRVVMGGTAPFGDPPGGARTQPARFDRELFCLSGRLRARSCAAKPMLDVFAHHPYSVGGPTRAALNPDDVIIPDFPKLTRIFKAAGRAGTVLPRGRKDFWVTEMGWDTRPPDPHGVPAGRQAQWLSQSWYLLWRSRVTHALNLQLRDSPVVGGGGDSYQQGIFYSGATPAQDRPKPGFYAYRFPFAVDGARSLAWGVSPCACRIAIERSEGRSWKRVASLTGRRDGVFTRRISIPRGARFRARGGAVLSLPARAARLTR